MGRILGRAPSLPSVGDEPQTESEMQLKHAEEVELLEQSIAMQRTLMENQRRCIDELKGEIAANRQQTIYPPRDVSHVEAELAEVAARVARLKNEAQALRRRAAEAEDVVERERENYEAVRRRVAEEEDEEESMQVEAEGIEQETQRMLADLDRERKLVQQLTEALQRGRELAKHDEDSVVAGLRNQVERNERELSELRARAADEASKVEGLRDECRRMESEVNGMKGAPDSYSNAVLQAQRVLGEKSHEVLNLHRLIRERREESAELERGLVQQVRPEVADELRMASEMADRSYRALVALCEDSRGKGECPDHLASLSGVLRSKQSETSRRSSFSTEVAVRSAKTQLRLEASQRVLHADPFARSAPPAEEPRQPPPREASHSSHAPPLHESERVSNASRVGYLSAERLHGMTDFSQRSGSAGDTRTEVATATQVRSVASSRRTSGVLEETGSRVSQYGERWRDVYRERTLRGLHTEYELAVAALRGSLQR